MENTESAQLVAAIAALRRCEERSLAGHFALEVMHEIRNPLDALGNLVHLALNESNPGQISEYLKIAREQVNTLHQIAGQSLSLARRSDGEVRVLLLQLADAALRVHHRRITTNQANITRDFGEDQSVMVRSIEIVQVLTNLVGNALDAISLGGRISLRIRKRADHVCILVADDGAGIAHDHLQRIFEPFFTTKKDDGNGLGLALSKKLIERHGGTISVRSSTAPRRHGATFRVCLPLASL